MVQILRLTVSTTELTIIAGGHFSVLRRIPGTKGQAHQLYPNADHFIQEAIGVGLANKLISFIKANPV